MFGDGTCYYVALFAALALRNMTTPSPEVWSEHFFAYSILFPLWIIVCYIADLYHPPFMHKRGAFYSRALVVTGIMMAISAILFYVLAIPAIAPKTVLFIHGSIFFLLFVGWRNLAATKMLSIQKKPVMFIGDQAHFYSLQQRMQRNVGSEYGLIGYVDLSTLHGSLNDMPSTMNAVQEEAANGKINFLVVQDDKLAQTLPLFHALLLGPGTLQTLSSFFEQEFQELLLESISSAGIADSIDLGGQKIYDRIKRCFDIFVALILIVLGGMIAAPIIAVVRLCSGKPVFYSQKRCTKDGRIFTLYKFRTMVLNAEKEGPVWAEKRDSRTTRIGRFLRYTHIDELPQAWNVLRGDLSFVGPRPERPDFVRLLEEAIPYYALRHRITPGISGWAQINFPYAASVEDARRKLSYDLYYLKHRSFTLDLKIFLKTVAFIIKGEGG